MTADDSSLEFDSEGPDKRAIAATDAETRLLNAVKNGEYAIIPGAPKPKQTDGWTDDQTVRADFLRHLCLHPDLYDIDPRGIRLIGARITDTLDLRAATLHRPLWIRESRFEAAPILRDANTDTFSLQGCHLPGLLADRLTITGTLRFDDSSFSGEVRIAGATLSGNLDCTKAAFDNAGRTAFSAYGLKCGGSVVLLNVTASGETNLMGAEITRDLNCEQATFDNAGGTALNTDGLKCGGNIFLDSVTASGTTRLVGAEITGNLSCIQSIFDNADGKAFGADRLKCGGSVFLRNVTATGETLLLGANIAGNLECDQATFDNPDGDAFNAERMTVQHRFFWRDLACPPQGIVNITHARVGDFFDDGSGWPQAGQLKIDGFQYENLGGDTTVDGRCEWLGRMPKTSNSAPVFSPQPYEQLVKVLRIAGHERDARLMAIAKLDAYRDFLKAQDAFQDEIHEIKDTTPEVYRAFNRDKAFSKILRTYATRTPNFLRRAWYGFFKAVANYGYEPWHAGYWLALFWLLGTLIFGWAEATTYMRPAKERITASTEYTLPQSACEERGWRYVPAPEERAAPSSMCIPADYTAFHAVTYSLDILIPIVDLHQETFWEPSSAGWSGGFLRFWLWFQIIAGWVLTTVTVVGFTGVIKKD